MAREPALLPFVNGMAYKLSFTRRAEKELAKLPKTDIVAILEHCALLETDDRSVDIKKLHPPLSGYRMRVGQYRVLYVYEDSTHITVHAIKHRKDAYR
jgi:mRNA interferase RelE/StbE